MLPRRRVWAAAAMQPCPACAHAKFIAVHRDRPWLHLQQQLMQISRPSYAESELIIFICLCSRNVTSPPRSQRTFKNKDVKGNIHTPSLWFPVFLILGCRHAPFSGPQYVPSTEEWLPSSYVFLQRRAGDSQSSWKIKLDLFVSAFPARKW